MEMKGEKRILKENSSLINSTTWREKWRTFRRSTRESDMEAWGVGFIILGSITHQISTQATGSMMDAVLGDKLRLTVVQKL